MSVLNTFVFPGLDGTTHMLSDFHDLAPTTHNVTLFELPSDQSSYEELSEHFASTPSRERQCVIIAESFSGPLAVILASRHPESVACLILVASFVTSPSPRVSRCVPWSLMFRLPLPSLVARYVMLGKSCESKAVRELQAAVRSIPTQVLARRMRQVIQVDVTHTIRELTCPIMYLRPSHDALVPQRCVDAIRQLRPDATIHTIKGSHLILETQPGEAWKKIVDFTRRIVTAQS